MKARGLKIWGRLALAFGVLLALQLLMAGVALIEVRNVVALSSEKDRLSDSRHLVQLWSEQTRANVVRAVMLAKAGSPPALAEWTGKEMKQASAAISGFQTQLESRLVSDEARNLMGRIASSRTAYLALRADLMARLGKPAEAAGALADVDRTMLPAANSYLLTLDAVVELVDRDLKAQSTAMARRVDVTLLLLPALAAAALVLGALLAWLVARSLVRPIREVITVAHEISTGDLTRELAVNRRDELGELQQALATMQARLREMVSGIRSGTDSVSVATTQIASGNLDLSSRTEQASSSLQQTAAAMSQLSDTMNQSAGSARDANMLAGAAQDVARRGGDMVSRVVATMGEINDGSARIADIIGVIDGIAFQTNILALNAAVEAARAGEQGRGFAVVAAEVRNLAGRSADAAREIKTLIGASVEKVGAGTLLVKDAGATMDEIVQSVQRVTESIAGITSASEGQATGIGEINTAVGQLDQITQQNAALVEEAAAAAQSLREQAAGLARMVMSFRLSPQAA